MIRLSGTKQKKKRLRTRKIKGLGEKERQATILVKMETLSKQVVRPTTDLLTPDGPSWYTEK